MRRKVIQDFANVFCQRVAQLPEGYDLASFVNFGSGNYELDLLTGQCLWNGRSIPTLRACEVYKKWLWSQLDKHVIDSADILGARLSIGVKVSELNVRLAGTNELASAYFNFDIRSEIKTDEKNYLAQLQHEQTWGFDWYYNQLYGSTLHLLTPQSET